MVHSSRRASKNGSVRTTSRSLHFLLFIFILLGLLIPQVPSAWASSDSGPRALGTYSAELRSATGHIDTAGMITSIKALHANTYDYLVLHRSTDWEDLPGFLQAAAKEDISVRVVLSVPWPEATPPVPYGDDFVVWARQLSQLSVAYPNLKAMIIDDFIHKINPVLSNSNGDPNGPFTVSYVKQIYTALHSVNRNLKLLVGAYTLPAGFAGTVATDFVQSYGDIIDGMWIAHWNTNVGDLEYELERIGGLLQGKDLQVVIYANNPDTWWGPFRQNGTVPTPDYVRTALTIAYKYATGVTTYCLPLSGNDPFYPTLYPVVSDLYLTWSSVTIKAKTNLGQELPVSFPGYSSTPLYLTPQGPETLTAPGVVVLNGTSYYLLGWEDGSGSLVSKGASFTCDTQSIGRTLYLVYEPFTLTVRRRS